MLLFEESAQLWTWKCLNKPIRHIWAVLIQHFEQKRNGSLDQYKTLPCCYLLAKKSKLHLGWNNTSWPFSCISKMMVQKNTKERLFFPLYYLLPDLLCYILLQSFNISTNLKVFPFKWCQAYAYPCFRAWATGGYIWVCHFRQTFKKGVDPQEEAFWWKWLRYRESRKEHLLYCIWRRSCCVYIQDVFLIISRCIMFGFGIRSELTLKMFIVYCIYLKKQFDLHWNGIFFLYQESPSLCLAI